MSNAWLRRLPKLGKQASWHSGEGRGPETVSFWGLGTQSVDWSHDGLITWCLCWKLINLERWGPARGNKSLVSDLVSSPGHFLYSLSLFLAWLWSTYLFTVLLSATMMFFLTKFVEQCSHELSSLKPCARTNPSLVLLLSGSGSLQQKRLLMHRLPRLAWTHQSCLSSSNEGFKMG